jgi:predicted AAA+ superfamily ATPase
LVRSLARNVATEVTITTMAADAGGADGELSRVTVSEYLTALERLMVIEDQPAWAPHLRSTRQLRSSAKRHFADPSLAVAALRAGPERTTRASRGEHAVLGVITATGYGDVRDDGIAVIPIGTLRA